ncbi:class I SAM-dependent methyltransferase [Brevibacillus nitrificans]|uniref:class I SAM-dependent methyltransferase n=1 Tax=Brevibacillus nitrificans TaxID=651560 RepID=UPI001C82B8B3|nr:methyltransferase domain-containing protein [Brevibacillus nitrificans]
MRDEIIRYRPSRVLDVGCGEGWLARTLNEEGIDVVGIDGSPAHPAWRADPANAASFFRYAK